MRLDATMSTDGQSMTMRSQIAHHCRMPQSHASDQRPDSHLVARSLLDYRRIVVLTEGHSASKYSKTATSLLRYRTDDVVAVQDSAHAGRKAGQVFGCGHTIPIVASLHEVSHLDALFIGIAPDGGRLPQAWGAIIAEALRRGVDVVSGLHEFLSDVIAFRELASAHGARIIDVRRNAERKVSAGSPFRESCLRILTVGNDCCVGKMVVALEVQRRLKTLGHNARFLATGQTGVMIAGRGVPVDAVVADFISGAVEDLVLEHQVHDTLLIEGQGSLAHPSYSGVTVGLLHGCAPQGLIMCYDAARLAVKGMPHVLLRPLPELIRLYESIASLRYACEVIAIAIRSQGLSSVALAHERQRIESLTGLPACDVYRDGPDVLAQAVLNFRAKRIT
jgi:uncharacterized NAD-dependent epimerase/dehydratase family protein